MYVYDLHPSIVASASICTSFSRCKKKGSVSYLKKRKIKEKERKTVEKENKYGVNVEDG